MQNMILSEQPVLYLYKKKRSFNNSLHVKRRSTAVIAQTKHVHVWTQRWMGKLGESPPVVPSSALL